MCIAASSGIIGALDWGELFDEAADSIPECIDGACSGGAQETFELAEGEFDRIEIGTVGRQVEDGSAAGVDCLTHADDLVAGEIVQDDDITWPQYGCEHLLDIGEEGGTIDRAVEHEGRNETVTAQTAEEGGGVPMTVWHGGDQALAAWGATMRARHVGGCPSFIEEDQPGWIKAWRQTGPGGARFGDVGAVLLGRAQAFF